jgi:hypothetical protein
MAQSSQEYLVSKKIEYILLRYKLDSKKLSITLKIELLRRWIQSCAECEEYEMALVLKRERNKLVRMTRLVRIGERTFWERFRILWSWHIRKFKRIFSQITLRG